MDAPTLQKARMLQILRANQPTGAYIGIERHVNENRVKTFIELTRQALEEDRIGQPDIFYRRKPTLDYRRSDRKRESEGLRRKG